MCYFPKNTWNRICEYNRKYAIFIWLSLEIMNWQINWKQEDHEMMNSRMKLYLQWRMAIIQLKCCIVWHSERVQKSLWQVHWHLDIDD